MWNLKQKQTQNTENRLVVTRGEGWDREGGWEWVKVVKSYKVPEKDKFWNIMYSMLTTVNNTVLVDSIVGKARDFKSFHHKKKCVTMSVDIH